jgi:hypothetical protein
MEIINPIIWLVWLPLNIVSLLLLLPLSDKMYTPRWLTCFILLPVFPMLAIGIMGIKLNKGS